VLPPPVPGTPYHLLASAPPQRWRRLAVAVAGVLVAIFAGSMVGCAALGIAVATGRPGDRDGLPSFGDLGDTAWQLLVLAAFIPPLMLAARAWQRRRAGTLSSVCGRLRWAWLGICILVAVVADLLYVGVELMLEFTTTTATPADLGFAGWVGWRGFVIAVPVLLALVPLQAAAEEYLFRGWLLQALSGLGGAPWIAMTISAVLFALAHGLGTGWGFVDLVAFALITGWLAVRTGGLEAGIAMHMATNLVEMIWQAAIGTLSSTATAADNSWRMTTVDVTMVVLYAVVIVRLARRRGIAAVVPQPAADAAAGALPVPV
jgi:membrane protease YdiL (CAAX protease family)